jgi:hypothetical protein
MSFNQTQIVTAMKHKRTPVKQKAIGPDYGKDLYHVILFLLGLLAALWYFQL